MCFPKAQVGPRTAVDGLVSPWVGFLRVLARWADRPQKQEHSQRSPALCYRTTPILRLLRDQNKQTKTTELFHTLKPNCGVFWNSFQILIGGNISGNTVLEDDFSTLDSRKWLLHPGGTKMPVCGSTGDALVFIEKASTRYVVTTDIAVNEDSFLQIDFAASCSVTDSCYGKYSTRWGTEAWVPMAVGTVQNFCHGVNKMT